MSMRIVKYYGPGGGNKKWCVVYQDTDIFNEKKKPFEAYYANREGKVRRAWTFKVKDDMALLRPKFLSWCQPELNTIKAEIKNLKRKPQKLKYLFLSNCDIPIYKHN